mmetsp:Transcript_74330/g.135816  ORF Transcript_74330/g.135816 Transcript_74330/m.135816 type:complete len:220 (-) Transcript_74330:184-843(-)
MPEVHLIHIAVELLKDLRILASNLVRISRWVEPLHRYVVSDTLCLQRASSLHIAQPYVGVLNADNSSDLVSLGKSGIAVRLYTFTTSRCRFMLSQWTWSVLCGLGAISLVEHVRKCLLLMFPDVDHLVERTSISILVIGPILRKPCFRQRCRTLVLIPNFDEAEIFRGVFYRSCCCSSCFHFLHFVHDAQDQKDNKQDANHDTHDDANRSEVIFVVLPR